jgi:hypothetical protein
VEVTPVAISDSVFTEHGATIMPSVRKEPLEQAAPTSLLECTTSASASTSSAFRSVSMASVMRAACDRTTCVSTPTSRRIFRRRMPYITPEAPVMPTTIRLVGWLPCIERSGR